MLLVPFFIVALLGISAHGFQWQSVTNPDNYDADTLYYQSSTGTYGSCGYITSAVGRFPRGAGRCYIPFQGEEFEVVLPYDVLVTDKYQEFMIWSFVSDANQIREDGVKVCDNCDSGNAIYVCADRTHGPGKLIVRDDNSVTCFVSYNGDEHVTTDYHTLILQPANEYRLTDMEYNLDLIDILEDEPTQLTELIIINQDNTDQESSHSLTYSKTTSNEWANELGFALGVTMSVSAGIPLFVETGWEVSVEESWSYAYGESFSETVTTSTQANVNVPARHTCTVSIVGRQMVANVPYSASAVIIFPDGNTSSETITGVYEGLSINQDQIVYEPCVPID